MSASETKIHRSLPRSRVLAALALFVPLLAAAGSHPPRLVGEMAASAVELIGVDVTGRGDAPTLTLRLRTPAHPGVYICHLLTEANGEWAAIATRFWVGDRGRPAELEWSLVDRHGGNLRIWCPARR